MIVEVKQSTNEIFVSFEESEFRAKDKSGRPLWIELKEAIKERFPYPEARYDGELKVWRIQDSKSNRAGLQAIYKLYLNDPNQEELF